MQKRSSAIIHSWPLLKKGGGKEVGVKWVTDSTIYNMFWPGHGKFSNQMYPSILSKNKPAVTPCCAQSWARDTWETWLQVICGGGSNGKSSRAVSQLYPTTKWQSAWHIFMAAARLNFSLYAKVNLI